MPNETYLFADDPKPEIKQPHKDPAQKLLDWLQTWDKPTIGAAQILMYGPRCTRKRKDADNAIAILIQQGWIVHTPTNQSNWRQWQIVRKPIVHPTLAD